MRRGPLPVLVGALSCVLMAGQVAAQAPAAFAVPSATPVASPSPAGSAAPDALADFQDRPGIDSTPGGLAWQAVEGPLQSHRSGLTRLTTWSGGFVAVEERFRSDKAPRAAVLWVSPDGRTWNRAPLPRLDGDILGLVPFRGGLALLTTDRRVGVDAGGGGFLVHVWRSPDAVEWREVGSFGASIPSSWDGGWSYGLGAPMAVNGRLVVLAHLARSTGGGWVGPKLASVGGTALHAPVRGEERLIGWWSRDGGAWSAAPVTGLRDVPGHTTRSPAGVRAFDPALLESRDGLAWRRIASWPPFYEWGGPDGLLWVDGTSLVYGDNGDREGAEGCGNRLGVWRSESDGWSETLDRQVAAVNDGDADRSAVILVGWSWCLAASDDAEWSWVLVSRDGGRTWDPDASWVGAVGTCFGDVAIREGTAVMLSCGILRREAPRAAIWVAPIP